MSIENSFLKNSKPIIFPKHFYSKYNRSFSTIIFTFSYKLREYLLEENIIELLDDVKLKGVDGIKNIYKIKNEDILVFFTNIGAPAVVGYLEELKYIFDLKNIVFFGSAGIIDKNIKPKEIIIPTSAYRDEGTSYHYLEKSDYVDIKKAYDLAAIFDKYNIFYHLSKTWTTDAFYRETYEFLNARLNEGCGVVEMEISAVQAFSLFYNLNFYPFIYGADELSLETYQKSSLGNLVLNSRVIHFNIALLIAKEITK